MTYLHLQLNYDTYGPIFRPHRTCVAYRGDLYLAMFMDCLSVVGHADVLWQNNWTDRDAVYSMWRGVGDSHHVLDGGPDPPTGRHNFRVGKGPSHSIKYRDK